ncbi:MAG TPA: hypothetical protein VH186_34265 [Chloroflexia bacterium]|nr:hypothetical protein [Chloroflexia bacterium]
MSRRFASYYPLALTLLFGFVISLLPVSPAFGDNIGACQGSGSSSAKLTLGGRVITSSQILLANGTQPCASGETKLGLVSLFRTIVVSPNGTPAQNGTALLTAMTTISNSTPSASNPWLLKLEPGNYDLNGNSLTLLPFVDLEGSGEDVTFISSSISSGFPPTQGTLTMAANSTARLLQVANSNNGFRKAAVVIPATATNVQLSHINAIETTTGGGEGYALYNNGSVTIQNSQFTVAGATTDNVGVRNDGGTLNLQGSQVTGTSGGTMVGIFSFAGGTTNVANSNIAVSGGSTSNIAAAAQNSAQTSTLIITNSTLNATGISSFGAVNFSSTTSVFVGGSGINGASGNTSGTVHCVASWTGSFNPLTC